MSDYFLDNTCALCERPIDLGDIICENCLDDERANDARQQAQDDLSDDNLGTSGISTTSN